MAIKYREAEELRFTTRKNLTSSPENWLEIPAYSVKHLQIQLCRSIDDSRTISKCHSRCTF